jgi:hypothetical protein
MLKALFIIGQCVRLLHTDPWQDTTYEVEVVGKYSYQLFSVNEHGEKDILNFKVLTFDYQKYYEVVECPKPNTITVK